MRKLRTYCALALLLFGSCVEKKGDSDSATAGTHSSGGVAETSVPTTGATTDEDDYGWAAGVFYRTLGGEVTTLPMMEIRADHTGTLTSEDCVASSPGAPTKFTNEVVWKPAGPGVIEFGSPDQDMALQWFGQPLTSPIRMRRTDDSSFVIVAHGTIEEGTYYGEFKRHLACLAHIDTNTCSIVECG